MPLCECKQTNGELARCVCVYTDGALRCVCTHRWSGAMCACTDPREISRVERLERLLAARRSTCCTFDCDCPGIIPLRRFISETSKLKKSWKLFKFNGLCEMNILLNLESIYSLVSEKINIKNEFLYTGSYGSTLVRHRILRMWFF